MKSISLGTGSDENDYGSVTSLHIHMYDKMTNTVQLAGLSSEPNSSVNTELIAATIQIVKKRGSLSQSLLFVSIFQANTSAFEVE